MSWAGPLDSVFGSRCVKALKVSLGIGCSPLPESLLQLTSIKGTFTKTQSTQHTETDVLHSASASSW